MDESYETFEEELGPPRAEPPPQKPVRQIHRPEMYTTRKIQEETAPLPQQPKAEAKTSARDLSFPRTVRTPSLRKSLSIQNLTQIETPWENVTLNRCLFVAITILVLTSGIQRLNETLRGHGAAEEEEVELTVRRSGILRHRGQPPEPETTLWEVMFWWLPDLDDEEDDDEDDDEGEVKRGNTRKAAKARAPRGIRNKPLPDKKLMKRREGKPKGTRVKKGMDEETKDKKERDKQDKHQDAAHEEDEGEENETPVHKKNKKSEEKREMTKTQKG